MRDDAVPEHYSGSHAESASLLPLHLQKGELFGYRSTRDNLALPARYLEVISLLVFELTSTVQLSLQLMVLTLTG
jgi:hypothetical protein